MTLTRINGGTQIQAGTILDAAIASSAAIATSKLADGANFITRDGSIPFTASPDAGTHTIINVSAPVNPTDAANKSYVDTFVQGMSQKPTARAAVTGALPANTYANGASGVGATLTANTNGALAAQDGVTLAAGDILWVDQEATASHNGLYTVTQLGDGTHPYILTRHIDMDQAPEFSGALIVIDNEGTTRKNQLWLVGYSASFTVGTTSVAATQLNAATTYTQGNGVTISGTTISVNNGNGLGFSSGALVVTAADASINVSGSGIKVTTGTGGQVYIANGSGICTPITLSGEVSSVSSAGVVTLDATKVMKFANFANRETPSGSMNGSNTAFTLAHTPVSGSESIYLNGVLQDAGSGNDYTISGGTITMIGAPSSTDKLRVTYWY